MDVGLVGKRDGNPCGRGAALKRTSLVVLAILGVAACGNDGAERAALVAVTDSAGQLHVRVADLAEFEPSGWLVEELYNTGTEPSRIELFRVTSARFLADGSLAVANSGSYEILFLGPEGRVQRRMGGSGEGPGEFRYIHSLDVDTLGNLLAYDARLGRITRIAPDGSVLEMLRLQPEVPFVDLRPLAFLNDRRVLAIHGESRVFAAGGERRDSSPLLLFDSAGALPDTLGVWPAQEWSYVSFSEGTARFEVGFGRSLAYAGRSGYSVLGSTDSVNLTVFDRNGRVSMRVTGAGPHERVEPADIELMRAEQLERASGAPEFYRQAIPQAPYRETFPAFGALAVDDAQRIWIGAYVHPGDTLQKWVLIGPDGDLRGTVDLPADARVLDAAGDRLAVLRRNEVDEEYIAVLRVVRPS